MKYLPAENIVYKTKLKEEEILKRLSGIIEPKKTFRFGESSNGGSKPYEGQINDHSFDIQRIISYRNSFLPRINGIVERDFDGVTIKVKMRLHVFVIVFLGIFGSGFVLACLGLLAMLIRRSEFNIEPLFPFGMLIFVYLLALGGFKSESNKSKKELQALFEADIMEG